jgi:hypothetical protein
MNNATMKVIVNDKPVAKTKSVRPRTPRAPKANPGVVDQVKNALQPKALVATICGFLLGGLVPLASFTVAHYELRKDEPFYFQFATLLVLGGLLYSAKTVYEWGKLAFRNTWKALGFVVLTEGIMVTSHTGWLSFVALAYLIVINGIATGCNLSRRDP